MFGATGLVGRTMLKVLEERNFPVSDIVPLASPRSAGQVVLFKGREFIFRCLPKRPLKVSI